MMRTSSNDLIYRFSLTTHHRTNVVIVHLREQLAATQCRVIVVLDIPLPQLALNENGLRKALLLEKPLCILIRISQHKSDTVLQVLLQVIHQACSKSLRLNGSIRFHVNLFVRCNSTKYNLHEIAIFKQTIRNSSNHTVVS